MPKFLLLLRESGTYDPGVGPDEIQKIIQRYQDWSARLQKQGKLVGGEKLSDGEGKILRREGASLGVTDGPFPESKEIIGGIFTIEASSYDEAVALSRDCPHLDFGAIEIRRIDEL